MLAVDAVAVAVAEGLEAELEAGLEAMAGGLAVAAVGLEAGAGGLEAKPRKENTWDLPAEAVPMVWGLLEETQADTLNTVQHGGTLGLQNDENC